MKYPMTAPLDNLIEALRNELQQYGEMLALLDHQRELVKQRGSDDILHSIAAISTQSASEASIVTPAALRRARS